MQNNHKQLQKHEDKRKITNFSGTKTVYWPQKSFIWFIFPEDNYNGDKLLGTVRFIRKPLHMEYPLKQDVKRSSRRSDDFVH